MFDTFDIKMMRRALRLASCGEGRVSPNPQVGAVVAVGERIIGEGYHRHWGGPHAEVNALASVSEADRPLLRQATMYVTLEPCSHYGKTPPCADLIVREGLRRVIVATVDPFPQVSGRGIARIRRAGIEVETGLLEEEARWLNRRFFTAHSEQRPFVQLKWAQSADGYMASLPGEPRAILSSPLGMTMMHRERASADAIFVGTETILADRPRLDCRLWSEHMPAVATFDSERLPEDAFAGRRVILRKRGEALADFLHRLYSEEKITSLMVEGGAKTLGEYLDTGLWDEIRRETVCESLGQGLQAPQIIM